MIFSSYFLELYCSLQKQMNNILSLIRLIEMDPHYLGENRYISNRLLYE
jgi:hypothetical protein